MARGPISGALVAMGLALGGGCATFPEVISSNRDALLAEQPSPVRRAWVHGGFMQAVMTGDPQGRPVVFVHGSPGSWDANAHLLNTPALREGHLLLTYDRPGYGGSSPHQTEPSLQRQAAALAGLLDAFGVREPVILAGHSMGGPVIARFAMDFPDRVSGLIFIAASVDPALETWRWYNRAASWRLAYRILPEPLLRSNEEIGPLKAELEAMLPLWGRIRAPAAILHGTDDPLVPVANVPFLEAHLSAVPVREWIVPGADHYILWDHVHLVEEALAWLESGPSLSNGH